MSMWAYFDIMYIVINSLVSISLVDGSILTKENLRIVEAFLSIIIILKLVYYTQLIDGIAPLISIIIQIFIDIGWFMVIFCIIIFAFAYSFYLIGKNQIGDQDKARLENCATIDDACEEEYPYPGYETLGGAIQHVFLLSLGEFGLEDYDLGGHYKEYCLLWFFFVVAAFILMLHLLNMLIAIMGETFGSNYE